MNIKKEKELTILTPSYNRAGLLNKLYKSLLNQTNKNFVWMISDDGSTDNTKEVVDEFINENKIEIIYISKANGGKHTALNYSIPKITTFLTFIVDSDDSITDDAVEIIYSYHNKYKNHNNLCGYSFLVMYPDGKINGSSFPPNEPIESYIKCRINRKIGGDKSEIFYTKCLQEFPFPEFPNERFLNEDIVWIQMALKYKMVHINKPIYIAEYLEGGLTKSGKALKAKNPLGGMERGRWLMNPKCRFLTRIKGALFYIVFAKFANMNFKELIDKTSYKSLITIHYPIGYIIHKIFRKKFANEL